MPVQLVRKPPIGNTRNDRLKITLAGNHSLDEKLCMAMQIIHSLKLEGFDNAGTIDFYVPLIDPDQHPLTHFANGNLIADYNMLIDSPYQSAADEYDRRQAPSVPRPY